MFKNILVATDGSPLGRSAVETTANLANKFEATVNLVTIVGQGNPRDSSGP